MKPSLDQFVTFLNVANLEATADFYGRILGLPLILDQGPCHIYQITPTAFIGFCTQGTAVDRQSSIDRSGVIITLVSDDVDAWHKALIALEVPIEKPPTFYEKFNIYHLFVRDPDNYLVEIQTFRDPAWPRPPQNST